MIISRNIAAQCVFVPALLFLHYYMLTCDEIRCPIKLYGVTFSSSGSNLGVALDAGAKWNFSVPSFEIQLRYNYRIAVLYYILCAAEAALYVTSVRECLRNLTCMKNGRAKKDE